MMKYHSYKDSGIDWLGEKHPIPKHWSVKRVKDLGNYQSGSFIDASEMDIENPYPVYGGNGIRGLAKKYNHNGDYILIGRQGALCGNINYASGKFWATEHAVVVYKKKEYNLTWLGELFRVMNFNQYSLSAAQPGLSVDRIKRLELPIPTVEEQTAIAEYLDTKTQAIDKKVCLLEKKIGYYQELRKSLINETVTKGLDINVKLKDSGIDWIGQIPEHWEVRRLKDIYEINKRIVGSNFYQYKLLSLTQNGIIYRDTESGLGKYPAEFDTYQIVMKTDLVFCLFDMDVTPRTVGYCELEGMITGAYTIMKATQKIENKYFYYLFLMADISKKLSKYYTGLRNTIKKEVFLSLSVVVPSLSEQIQISNYLTEKTSKIDQIITNIQTQITTLKELRKTLINDVVTGKIKVSESGLAGFEDKQDKVLSKSMYNPANSKIK
jgi:type I restriction enzyme S subunit